MGIGIDWCERRLISNLCMDQSVKVLLHPGERRSVKTGRRVREGSCFFAESIPRVQHTFGQGYSVRFRDFKLGGQVIRDVQCADGFVLLAKEATAIQDVINPLVLEMDI